MDILMTRTDNTVIAKLSGRLDVNSVPGIEAKLMVPASIPKVELILDFSQVEYLSSYGLRMLLQLAKQLGVDGGRLKLAAVPEMIQKVLQTSGLIRFFALHPTVAAAKCDDTVPEKPDFI